MPRIRCHYIDCVFLDEGYCAAAAVELDPEFADAHYNLSGLYDQVGNAVAAFRHLRRYRELTGRPRR